MRLVIDDGNGRRGIQQLSFPQTKQAAAIMDCIGRLIPQEGIDYDIEVVFKGSNDPNVSMNIISKTDKGEWWKNYVTKMISKYPPKVENPEPSIPIDVKEDEKKQEGNNEEIVP